MTSFRQIPTDYKRIVISSILLIALTMLLYLIDVFVFWGIFGAGATASEVAELWYVDLILNLLPIILVGSFLLNKIMKCKKKEEFIKFKAYTITLVILILAYTSKEILMKIMF